MRIYPHSEPSLQVEDSTQSVHPCTRDELLIPEHKQRCPTCIQSLPIKDSTDSTHKQGQTHNIPTSTYIAYNRDISRSSKFISPSTFIRLGTFLVILFNRSFGAVSAANPTCNRISTSSSCQVPTAFLGSFQKWKHSNTKTSRSESSEVRSDQTPAFRASPTFLEILEAATKGISSSVTSSTATTTHKRPRGRPESVPGAMSRSTILNMNEMEFNRMTNSNPAVVRYLDDIYDDQTVSSSSSSSSFLEDSNTFTDVDTVNNEDGVKKGRGRPRKYAVSSMDDTSIQRSTGERGIAESVYTSTPSRSPPLLPNSFKRPKASKSSMSNTYGNENNLDGEEETKVRKRVVKTLPKAKPRKKGDAKDTDTDDSGASSESTTNERVGTMVGSDDFEPPNLQKYYRTELLSSEEEYALGIKVQFMVKCEQVHEGLFLQSDRTPTLLEWANACGFKEYDAVICAPDFIESDIELMIRPSKSDAFDDDMDPSMFVGNGLVNVGGVGRGKGRVKKPPPLELKDYFDDAPMKFSQYSEDLYDDDDEIIKIDSQPTKGKIRPINRGTPRDFVNMMMVGREAKQRMVQCNMRLVVSIAKRYRHVGVNIADLVQEGSIGLTRAAEKFDPRKGFKFSTYASWWIQQAVFRSIAYHSRTIRLPVHVHNLLNRVRRVRLQLQQILGRTPTNEEMAAELNMTLPKYSKMLRLTRRAISLEMPKYQNNPKDIGQESEMLVGDTIDATEVIKDENSPEQSVDQVLFHDDLQEMLEMLGEDERRVVRARYGLDDGLTRTVSTVAAQLGQSKSWVRSMECRALRKLRRPWYEKRLWEHQNSLRR